MVRPRLFVNFLVIDVDYLGYGVAGADFRPQTLWGQGHANPASNLEAQ